MPIQSNQKRLSRFLGALVAVLAVVTMSQAQERTAGSISSIKIKNFGQMDERFYRGAQPREGDYKDLAALGIKTVIDLRDDPESYERPMVESLGMKYINIPMETKKYPTAQIT